MERCFKPVRIDCDESVTPTIPSIITIAGTCVPISFNRCYERLDKFCSSYHAFVILVEESDLPILETTVHVVDTYRVQTGEILVVVMKNTKDSPGKQIGIDNMCALDPNEMVHDHSVLMCQSIDDETVIVSAANEILLALSKITVRTKFLYYVVQLISTPIVVVDITSLLQPDNILRDSDSDDGSNKDLDHGFQSINLDPEDSVV
jgi:hypothetical protein